MKNPCRICGHEKSNFLLSKTRGPFKSTFVQCHGCQSARIDPYPSEEDLMTYYNSDYLEMDLSESENLGVSHKTRFAPEYRATVYNEYAYGMADLGYDTKNINNVGAILDFGCADGIFLDFLLDKGVSGENLYGYDIGSDMISIATQKGHNCTDKYEDLMNKKFGLITLWDVMEHVSYPQDVVKQVKSLLQVGGEVLVQTPNFGELGLSLGKSFAHYLVVEHVNLFSRKALIDIFENQGFRCLAQSSFGAGAYEKNVSQPYKSSYDQLAKKYDFGATQVLYFKLMDDE